MANGNNAPKADPVQSNMMARQIVLERAIDMWQSISAQTLVGEPRGQVVNVPLRNVGLIKRLLVEIEFEIEQAAAETLTRTGFGPANIMKQIVLTDLSNQTRINTTGWHMHVLASSRRQHAFGAANSNDSPVDIGSNFDVITAPASVTTKQKVRMFYEIPLAYGDYDLRGAIYANVVNATMNLQLTVNNKLVASHDANGLESVYKSSTTDLGTLSNFKVNVYQNYLDQLPMTQNGPVLPLLDLATAYLLNNTAVTGIAANQDNPIPYANFREFMSTFILYDNPASALDPGDEMNFLSIQSANYTNIIKVDPFASSLLTREILKDDFPAEAGATSYYFDHRRKPISTIQYGNMQLIFNPAEVKPNAQMLVGYEALAKINQVTQAGSLYGT